jgi:hypothetical protein
VDVPDVRRRVRAAIERARQDVQARRERSDAAARAFEEFLAGRAVPVFHMLASALVAEGHRFKVHTPAGSVRLASDRASDDFIELILDSSQDPPAVVGTISNGRGRRNVTRERPLPNGHVIDAISEDDVLEFVLAEIGPLVER